MVEGERRREEFGRLTLLRRTAPRLEGPVCMTSQLASFTFNNLQHHQRPHHISLVMANAEMVVVDPDGDVILLCGNQSDENQR